MDKNGRNGSWTACHYNRLNQTEVILTLGNYKVTIFMAIFWPLLVVAIGFSLMKYVKKLRPQREKEITREDRERILVLSTMTAFLNTDRYPAAYMESDSVLGSKMRRNFQQKARNQHI